MSKEVSGMNEKSMESKCRKEETLGCPTSIVSIYNILPTLRLRESHRRGEWNDCKPDVWDLCCEIVPSQNNREVRLMKSQEYSFLNSNYVMPMSMCMSTYPGKS